MAHYARNRVCPCVRCRASGLIGAAVLITVGILMLLDMNHVIDFGRSWPVLFLVIGAVLLVSRTGSTEGHIERGSWAPGAVPPSPSSPPADQQDPQVKL